jgi:endonuclease
MRLIVARCEVSYVGRVSTVLPEAVRLLMLKADGTFMVWADGGGPNVKPLNWMIPPTVVEEHTDAGGRLERLLVRKQRQEERLEITVS